MDFKLEKKGIGAGTMLLAAVFTLITFIMLPSLESLRDQRDQHLELRSVETLALEPPPTAVPETKPEPVLDQARPAPKPRLQQTRQNLPLNAVLDLDFGLTGTSGDFALDFEIDHGGGAGLEKIVFELSELDQNPAAIVKTPPIYPVQARLRRIEGEVVLQFVVDEQGEVRNITVVESNPEGTFTDTAMRAVRRWKFRPGIKDGQPVAARVQQRLSFKIE